jgi:hypothetical protein
LPFLISGGLVSAFIYQRPFVFNQLAWAYRAPRLRRGGIKRKNRASGFILSISSYRLYGLVAFSQSAFASSPAPTGRHTHGGSSAAAVRTKKPRKRFYPFDF